ncbi:cache domain-containing sensor histidine kinase [Paenibacillus rigui]|uniref:histidine kinase n=1 Tax=Paenibacillus rigui TaxID=554312 RepID=A0A229UWT1_9BACL|nr:sensor histidine kinase [Paenibacillus rigui]OXM87721.1 hypothetical protein CF651_00955 [Paenibacillus rigui]
MGTKWAERASRFVTGRLRNKLIFTFSTIVVLIVILLTYLSYRQTVLINGQNYLVNNQKLIKLVNQNLDRYIGQIDDLSLSPRNDTEFMDSLLSGDYLDQVYIQNQIKNMFYSRDDIEKISVYTPLTKQGYTISRKTVNLTQRLDNETEQSAWYREAIRGPKFRSIEPGAQGTAASSSEWLTFHRVLINITNKAPLAAISITLNDREFNKILLDAADNPEEFIGIFDESNQLIYKQGMDRTEGHYDFLPYIKDREGEAEYSNWSSDNTNFVLIDHISQVYHWKLVKLTPVAVLNQAASNARTLNLVVGGGLLVFFIIVIVVLSNAITSRLKTFSRRIEQLGEGNFTLDYEFKGTDEIAQLSKKFNQMVVNINELIAERYEIKISERNARLRALEAQINPHFLYNSLQAISTEAIIYEMDSIHLMVDALASSLRYCIKDGETVRLSDEVEHIRHYLILQHARFGTRLHVETQIADQALDCMIPKMSLQILLENAIEHALEQMSQAIHIEITAAVSQEGLRLQVKDDGPGFLPERLAYVRNSFNDHYLDYQDEIGLKNLYSRIKLLFGEAAELTIASEPGHGAEIRMDLPVRKEVRQYVQSTDY